MIWLSLFAAAQGRAGLVACEIAELTDTLPRPDATDVPTDLIPAMLWTGSCGIDLPVVVTLTAVGEPEPVFQQEMAFESFRAIGNAFLLEPAWGPLQADTDYEVAVESVFAEITRFGFTTGSDGAEPVQGALPAITIETAVREKLSQGLHPIDLTVRFESAGPPGAALYVLREDGQERAIVLAEDGEVADVSWFAESRQGKVCLNAVQRDGLGSWHGPSEDACEKIQRADGCSHTPPWLGLGAFLPLLAFRRRT